MDFLNEYHLAGLVIGICTFLIIGIFHPLVIKGEYYFGTGIRWAFLALGIVMCGLSILVEDTILSILAGVVAFSSFWSIGEVLEQEQRVAKGWFPANPKRRKAANEKP